MKPVWDQLSETYADSSSVVIADVDCTSTGGTEVCQNMGVQGYPTINYYVDGQEEKYQGGRDFAQLNEFVEDTLLKACAVAEATETCTEKEQKYITKMQAKTDANVLAQITRLGGMKEKAMKPELKQWLFQRLNILKQISEGKTEL